MLKQLIGNTPLVRLKRIEEYFNLNVELYGKLESVNLTGSIKDRPAYQILTKAHLKENSVIVEASSGNMGISLAAIGSYLGNRVIITMPENMSKERIELMKLYGAEVFLTKKSLGMKGAIEQTQCFKKKYQNVFLPNQFENADNWLAHYETTGPEIDLTLPKLDILVAGIGTGGTITGVGKYLKEKNSSIQIIGVEPASSPVLTEHRAGTHAIQGIGAGFVPKILGKDWIDEVLTCRDEEAFEGAKILLKIEKLWVGISSGAALVVALRVAKREENKGKKIVFIMPDHGSRYSSLPLFS